jgi:hypothetical protein
VVARSANPTVSAARRQRLDCHQDGPSVTDWARSFTLATDTDLEIQANGKYFTSSYLLDMREHTFAVRMVSGKVATLAIDPGPLDVPYQFLVRASGRGLRCAQPATFWPAFANC